MLNIWWTEGAKKLVFFIYLRIQVHTLYFFWKYNSEKFNYKVREYKVTFSSNDFFVPNNKFKAIQYSLKIKSVNFPTIKLTTVL